MRLRETLGIFVIGSLAACGGGSNGDGGNNIGAAGNGGEPAVAITSDNAEQIAAQAIASIDAVAAIGDSGFGFTGAIGAVVEADGESIANVALDMAERAEGQVRNASNLGAVGAIIEETQDCPAGGQLTAQIDTGSLSETEFANSLEGGSIPSGTSVSLSFQDCADPEQPIVNGTITIVFQQFAIDGELGVDPFTMEFDVTFDDLELGAERIDGDVSLLLISDAGSTELRLTGNSLDVTEGVNTMALSNFAFAAIEDNVETTVSIDFTLSASELGGAITVATQSALVTDLAAEHPRTGILMVTGANESSVTLTVLDAVNVQLDIDEDGDRISDATIITTWVELEAAA